MLYPINNAYRLTLSLDGIWNMSGVDLDDDPSHPLSAFILMAVPSSYQDLITDSVLRNHVGKLRYERIAHIPNAFLHHEIHLRIGAAPHRQDVFVDGIWIGSHEGGYLPFDVVIPHGLCQKESIRLSILIDNRATLKTLPIGEVIDHGHRLEQLTYFDFANYSGIHRSVFLYAVPNDGIKDITIKTTLVNGIAHVAYSVQSGKDISSVKLIDPHGNTVDEMSSNPGVFRVINPMCWDVGCGMLYTLSVKTEDDQYDELFGIRTVSIVDGKFLLNGRPVYLKGFGMHEDHPIIGKGHSTAHAIRDMNLLSWIHANSFRTSHYPYDEEMYRLADRYGFLVINEVPAVGMNFWSNRPVFVDGTIDRQTMENHKRQLTELIDRDKNHPSVVMISVANEANTHEEGAVPYFSEVFSHVRTLTDLPIMIVDWVGADANLVADMADVIGLNRYIGWYTDLEDLSVIITKLTKDLNAYFDKYHKPIMLTEFGADTISGVHTLPAQVFSEEFQWEFIKTYVNVLKTLPFVIGEHIWNFADFMTKPGLTRMHGNRKGVFTRDRQPKMVAHFLKEHWNSKK